MRIQSHLSSVVSHSLDLSRLILPARRTDPVQLRHVLAQKNSSPDRTRRGNADNDSTLKLRRTFEPRGVRNDPGKDNSSPRASILCEKRYRKRPHLEQLSRERPLSRHRETQRFVELSTGNRRHCSDERPSRAEGQLMRAKSRPSSPQTVAPRATLPKASASAVPRRTLNFEPSHVGAPSSCRIATSSRQT